MSRSTAPAALVVAMALASVSACATKKTAVYEHENFDDSGTYSRSFPVNEAGSCEAARRALLSQGYIITSSDANQVAGNKSFQQNSENHLQISFNVTCAPDSGDEQRSTMFANALQDRYTLKKSNTSASLGVGILGSVSMPIGSSDDSMVKVASETVTAAQFYDRYFALVESYLPKAKPEAERKAAESTAQTGKSTTPAPALGLPEPAATVPAAALQPVAPGTEPTPTVGTAPQASEPQESAQGSQPVTPPAEATPIQVQTSPAPDPASQGADTQTERSSAVTDQAE